MERHQTEDSMEQVQHARETVRLRSIQRMEEERKQIRLQEQQKAREEEIRAGALPASSKSPGTNSIPSSTEVGPTVVNGKSFVLGNLSQKANQERALMMLNSHKVRPQMVDGSDQSVKELRNQLFGVSGLRGNCPQFFLKDVKTGEFSFVGDFDSIESMNDEGSLKTVFG
jgi:hypothetical protein